MTIRTTATICRGSRTERHRKEKTRAGWQGRPATNGAVVEAARTGADLVTVTVVGNRELDILVTPGVVITFAPEDVPVDDRDTGDLEAPFAWSFDDYAQ